MPNGPHNVDLTVDAQNQYQFAGGSQGNGNCRNSVGQGAAAVQVTLDAPGGYKITGVTLSGTGADQMNSQVTGNGRSAVIRNSCTSPADVDYTIDVTTSNGTVIQCHPKIVNT